MCQRYMGLWWSTRLFRQQRWIQLYRVSWRSLSMCQQRLHPWIVPLRLFQRLRRQQWWSRWLCLQFGNWIWMFQWWRLHQWRMGLWWWSRLPGWQWWSWCALWIDNWWTKHSYSRYDELMFKFLCRLKITSPNMTKYSTIQTLCWQLAPIPNLSLTSQCLGVHR